MQTKIKTPISETSFSRQKTPRHALLCKESTRVLGESRSLSRQWFRLVGIWHIWRATIRNCYGRIRIQSPTERLDVGVGSAFERDQAGCYQANTRTLARASGIESLSATYSWLDIVDLHIFLMGFDAGERWILSTKDIAPKTPTQI